MYAGLGLPSMLKFMKSTNSYSSESLAIINNEIHHQNADNGPATLEGPEWRGGVRCVNLNSELL